MELEVMEKNVVMSAEIVPLFAQVTTTEKESVAEQLMKFESEAVTLKTTLDAIEVKDQESYDLCADKVDEGKKFVKAKTEWFEPIRLLTYGLYQKVLDTRGGIIKALDASVTVKDASLKKFEREKEEERQRIQRELEAKQRREDEERRLQAATAAEAVGLSEQAVETILTAPDTTPAPVAAPTFTRRTGLGHRENWCAEVTDFHALVKHVAKNKTLLSLLYEYSPKEKTSTNLNAQARSLKTALQLPGVRAVNKGS